MDSSRQGRLSRSGAGTHPLVPVTPYLETDARPPGGAEPFWKVGNREAHVSTEQPSPQEEARLSQSHEHAARPCRARTSPSQGPQASFRLTGHRSSQRWRPEDRLCRSVDFVRCYRRGDRRHGAWVTLFVHANDCGALRLGTTASRKVGNAVVRHRLKRWTREIIRRHPDRPRWPALDVVVHFKPGADRARFDELRLEIDRQLRRLLEKRR